VPHIQSGGMNPQDLAKIAYDHFAPVYDQANDQNDYELWLGTALLPELERHGLRTGWALDIGCGTGRAFNPLLARDWRVVGCDLSPGMLDVASKKFEGSVDLFESDARNLPPVAEYLGLPTAQNFDLVLLLNDVVNYTAEDGDLERVFAGVKLNLRKDHGLVIFDANTLALFGDVFTSRQMDDRMSAGDLNWEGLSKEIQPGFVYEARLSGRKVSPHIHRQRHWTREQIEVGLEASGLQLLAALGQQDNGDQIRLIDPPDEARDPKVVYIAADRSAGSGCPNHKGPSRDRMPSSSDFS
jgi:SAM-dependent methyltransferase